MRKFITAFMLLVGLGSASAAQETIQPGASATINKHGICRQVTNTTRDPMMIPTNTASEWSVGTASFLGEPRPGTLVAACSLTIPISGQRIYPATPAGYGGPGRDFFGRTLVMSGDGNRLFVGEPVFGLTRHDGNSGSSHDGRVTTFRRNANGSYRQEFTFVAPRNHRAFEFLATDRAGTVFMDHRNIWEVRSGGIARVLRFDPLFPGRDAPLAVPAMSPDGTKAAVATTQGIVLLNKVGNSWSVTSRLRYRANSSSSTTYFRVDSVTVDDAGNFYTIEKCYDYDGRSGCSSVSDQVFVRSYSYRSSDNTWRRSLNHALRGQDAATSNEIVVSADGNRIIALGTHSYAIVNYQWANVPNPAGMLVFERSGSSWSIARRVDTSRWNLVLTGADPIYNLIHAQRSAALTADGRSLFMMVEGGGYRVLSDADLNNNWSAGPRFQTLDGIATNAPMSISDDGSWFAVGNQSLWNSEVESAYIFKMR